MLWHSKVFFPFIISFHHFKLRCGLTQKRGGEHLLFFFPFYILESGLISSNSHNLFRANITFKTRSNSTKKLHWLFKRDYCANYFTYFFIAQLIFYPKPTVIYVLVFLPVLFYEKTLISLSNITKPSLKNISWYLFSFKLKIMSQVDSPELPETPEITEMTEKFMKATKYLTTFKKT